MKTVSKLLAGALTITVMLSATMVRAQTTPANAFRFGIGIEAADPTGNARLGSNFVLGGTARLQYGITDSFALTLTSGAYHFFPIDKPGTNIKYQSYGEIPIKAGFKEFFTPNLYFGAEAGIGVEQTDSGVDPTRFLWSPAAGYANQHWDVGFHYDHFSDQSDHFGVVALRVAYGFKL